LSTSTDGIIGGREHDNVRNAAAEFLKTSENIKKEFTATSSFRYPKAGELH